MKTLQASPDGKQNSLIYPLCTLYGLSAVNFALEMKDVVVVQQTFQQNIWIYRCWIVWGRRMSVTIIPLLLALAALGTTLSQMKDDSDKNCILKAPYLFTVNQGLYLAIDGLDMGLIVLKIVMVYLAVRPVMAHSGRENKFRPLVFILFILIDGNEVTMAYKFIRTILALAPLNGMIPTIILVREALGMSYNDTSSLSQTIESLHFAHNDDTSRNSNQEVEQLDARASDAQDIVEVHRSSTS
ncbi:hypothetical protein BYT27DRAFT_7255697 [Phlegmacium glaucopus]|nr:hypothetical protein BYT27DRAFT_7255697 [Phlegmacium glaucopus]